MELFLTLPKSYWGMLISEIFSFKISHLAYFTYVISLAVMAYFSKLSTEDMLVSASVDTASFFSLPISQLRGNEIRERQSYQDMPRLLALGSWV